MFRTKGERRTFHQNMGLATLLSMGAGCVNVAGFLAFFVLTTNVTGHVAMFAEELVYGNYSIALSLLTWMLLFLFGAFVSSILVQIGISHKRVGRPRVTPIVLEMALLLFVSLYGYFYFEGDIQESKILAGILFFAMGLQNAMVTVVSGSIVRTTHLTGLFTDLGIELGLLFLKKEKRPPNVGRKILLHTAIILCFFIGGVIGSLLFPKVTFLTFIFPIICLIIALSYTSVKKGYRKMKKKIIHQNTLKTL